MKTKSPSSSLPPSLSSTDDESVTRVTGQTQKRYPSRRDGEEGGMKEQFWSDTRRGRTSSFYCVNPDSSLEFLSLSLFLLLFFVVDGKQEKLRKEKCVLVMKDAFQDDSDFSPS